MTPEIKIRRLERTIVDQTSVIRDLTAALRRANKTIKAAESKDELIKQLRAEGRRLETIFNNFEKAVQKEITIRCYLRSKKSGTLAPQAKRAVVQDDDPGPGDDELCARCGKMSIDTGLECYECGFDNYEHLTGRKRGS